MSWQRFWYIVSFISLFGIIFYFGYLLGLRDKFNSQTDQTILVAPNGAMKNFLTKIESRSVCGSSNAKDKSEFGEMLFIVTENNNTQILITLKKIPDSVKSSQSSKEKKIPNQLNVYSAKKTKDGLDYEYQELGKIIFNEPINGLRDGKFSTVLDVPIFSQTSQNFERIEIKSDKIENENIFRDSQDPDLPIKARERAAPFFWINI